MIVPEGEYQMFEEFKDEVTTESGLIVSKNQTGYLKVKQNNHVYYLSPEKAIRIGDKIFVKSEAIIARETNG